jgi:hypothetical protein
MFPNFKSLADKERKRRALLAQLAKDAEIDRVKQEAYELAEWASDIDKKLDLSKLASKTTIGTQTEGAVASSTSPASALLRTIREAVDATTATAPSPDIGDEQDSLSDIDATSEIDDDSMMEDIEKLQMYMEDKDAPPTANSDRSMSDIQKQKLSRMAIIAMFERFPELVKYRITPIKSGGLHDELVYIGPGGELYHNASNKPSKKRLDLFDWEKTLSYIHQRFDDRLDESLADTMPKSNKDIFTTADASKDESDAYYQLKDILNSNDLTTTIKISNRKNEVLQILPVPYKKGLNRAGNPISLGKSLRINKDMNIIDKDNKVLKNRRDISWKNTLDMFILQLKADKISFKQSKKYLVPRPFVASTNGREVDADKREAATSMSQDDAKDDVLLMFNEHPELAQMWIKPTFKRSTAANKHPYKSKDYMFVEYAKVVKSNGNDLSREGQDMIDESIDWVATKLKVQNAISKIVPRSRRSSSNASSSSMHLSDLDDSSKMDMSGVGVAGLSGRRSILKHEFHKLQGEAGLGNDSRRVAKELKLIRRIF